MGENDIFKTAQETKKKLELIVENSFDGIYITDGSANTVMINHAYEQITGLDKKEVLGKNMKDLVKSKLI